MRWLEKQAIAQILKWEKKSFRSLETVRLKLSMAFLLTSEPLPDLETKGFYLIAS